MALAIALAIATPLAHGQGAPKRLSDWLLEQPASPAPYPLGLSWRVPEEVPAQRAKLLALLNALAGADSGITAGPEARRKLHEWLKTLPVTGRVPVAMADPRWLQANPARDPILFPGHSAVLPQRPHMVTVITGSGARCVVPHVPGYEAREYLEACDADGASRADWAWIAQPDGRVQRFGISAWNREEQDNPAPGAWIWGPARDSGWAEQFGEKLVVFLATQGPATDAGDVLRDEGGGGAKGEGRRTKDEAARSTIHDPGPTTSDPRSTTHDPRPAMAGGAAEGFRFGGSEGAASEPARVVAAPSGPAERSRGLQLTSNDWGNVGLLQTPTARMRPASYLSVHFSHTRPYTHGNIFAQPFDWLEAGFRYSDVSNRPYGAPELSGGQSYKDKGFDVKFSLWPESAYAPHVAIGFRDVAGTGFFSSEYLVASKRTGDFDWSLGLGWGYLAGHPRSLAVGEGGNFSFGTYFRGGGRAFGGVQWHTPWDKWILKLEYDPNNYQSEPLANNQSQSSHVNAGLVYRWGRATDFTLGFERGNRVMMGVSFHSQLDGLSTPKLNDPPRVPVAATRPKKPPDWAETAREIKRQADWNVRSIEQRGRALYVVLDDAGAVYWRDRVDRAAAVLHRDAPENVDRFVFAYRGRGQDMAEHVVDRNAWLAPQLVALPPASRSEAVIARDAEPGVPTAPDSTRYKGERPRLETGFRIGLTETFGGPDSFLLFQIYAEEQARLRLRDDTWVSGALHLGLIDNYDKFKYTAPSGLQRVRTFAREYQTSSLLTMPNLQLTHFGKLGQNQYYSLYGGYLEEMFGGVGGEWLYRPFASRVAFGVDVNFVRQREFDQSFGWLDPSYTTTTGHGTLYWDTGWENVITKLSAGRYLAGDSGVTVDLSRVFSNGVVLGAFATKTNVSAQQFGEGSFDKGVYLAIPFDAMFTRTIGTTANFVYRPLTRDGGAKLWRRETLYELTGLRSDRALKTVPAPTPNEVAIPSERREAWQPRAQAPAPYTRVTAPPTPRQWETNASHEFRLIETLYRQGFRNTRVTYDANHRLIVETANASLHPISRAVGRAARTALRLAPADARAIRIVFAERADPVVVYDFFELSRLERYLNGVIGRDEFAEFVAVEYLNPAARQRDPLARIDDVSTEPEPVRLTSIVPEVRGVRRLKDDVGAAAGTATEMNWLRAGAAGAGIVLASTLLDSRFDRFMSDHAGSGWLRDLKRVGNALPWLGLAGSAVAAFDGSNPSRSRTGYAAMEAGATALLVATGLKYAVGRARPTAGLGKRSFDHFSGEDRYQSFPSRHAALAWAVATPFALEYNAPWLYGLAAVTNLGRVAGRDHWFSDTVAGSVVGYGLGRLFWESSRKLGKDSARVMVTPRSASVSWDW